MTAFSCIKFEDFICIQKKITQNLCACRTLENASQEFVSALYDEFHESLVLARHFVTIPMKSLPQFNQDFVSRLSQSAGVNNLINQDTLVLSLLGTRGVEPEWNDRHMSKGHVGVPLVSTVFLDKIPMMSRLLKEIGFPIQWIEKGDTKIIAKTFKNMNSVFYVPSAKDELDNQGRKIISSQDFVEKYGIKTVFGFGGCYLGTTTFFATILFAREFVSREVVERFMLQVSKIKSSTHDLVESGRIFV